MFDCPILILTYNRDDNLLKLILILKKLTAKKIYISCDGPKTCNDIDKIKKIKNSLKQLHAKTKIITKFHRKNNGVKLGPQLGISWFFKEEKMGIILEDDCLPSLFFFKYAHYLLIKYRSNKKIFAICGYNHFGKTNFSDGSYFLSNYFLSWGWATWKRSWVNSNKNINIFTKKKFLDNIKKKFDSKIEFKYWKKTILSFSSKKIISWDMQFLASMWKQNSYCLLPNINMIDNIGFGAESTTSPNLKYKVAKVINYIGDIKDPSFLNICKKNENFIFNKFFKPKNFLYPWRLFRLIKYLFLQPKFAISKFFMMFKLDK